MAAENRQSYFTLFLRDDRGIAALEFALVAPVLILVVLGIIQFGVTLNNYEMLTGAAESAVRQLSLSRGSSTPYTTSTTSFYNSAINLTRANITIRLSVNGTQCTTDAACKTALTSGQGQPATVSASYPCNLQFYGYNFAPGCTLTSQSTESVE